MKIVLDSNIIMADFWMESTNFTILFESAKNGSIEIYIPEVVIDEVKNKYSQRLLKSKTDIKTELNKFNKLSKQNIGEILIDQNIDDAIKEYDKHLDKIIKDNKIQILPYPKVSHKFIAEKAMKKTKPFNANEKGYRDNLIWENIKDLLTDEELAVTFPELVFISNNHKDFAENNTRIPHKELLKELEERDFSTKSVVIYTSLSEYNDIQGKLFFEQATVFEGKLKAGEFYDLDLTQITSEYLFKNFVGSELYMYDVDVPEDYSDPTVRSISEDYKVEIKSVKKLNNNQFIIDVKFEVETEIDFFVDKHEYYYLNEEHPISIEDSDWNKWVMWATTSINVPLSMTIIINNDLEVINCQIDKVNENYAQQYV